MIETQSDILMTETTRKFPIKNIEQYTNRKFKRFLILTCKDRIQIKHNYNPDNTGILFNFNQNKIYFFPLF